MNFLFRSVSISVFLVLNKKRSPNKKQENFNKENFALFSFINPKLTSCIYYLQNTNQFITIDLLMIYY